LRRIGLVVLMVALNCALIPALAWGVFKVFGIQDAYVSGATLAAVGAAGAAGLKAAQLSKRADLALSVSIVVVLQLVNLAAVPLWASHVVSGASISAVTILKGLLLLVLLPLVIGLLVRARYTEHAESLQPELVKIANLALGLALVAGVSVNWSTIVSLLGSRVLLASVVVVLGALGLGLLVGGRAGFHGADLGGAVQLPRNDHHRDPAQRQPRLPGACDRLRAGRHHRGGLRRRGDGAPGKCRSRRPLAARPTVAKTCAPSQQWKQLRCWWLLDAAAAAGSLNRWKARRTPRHQTWLGEQRGPHY
jgi:hypothetical protein